MAAKAVIAQDLVEIIDQDSIETEEERLELMMDLLSGIEFESAADIGSGNMAFILRIADRFPDKTFVLEDIEPKICNEDEMMAKISELELMHIDTNKVRIHIGDERSTGLPDEHFDLVILSSTLHGIDDKNTFLLELKRILAPTGTLVIADAYYDLPPKPHRGCSNPFMTNAEMERFIQENMLVVIKDTRRVGVSSRSNGNYTSRIVQLAFP